MKKDRRKQIDEQRKCIRSFDRKYLAECRNSGLDYLGIGMLGILSVILMMIPWQELRREVALTFLGIAFLIALPAVVYVSRYIVFMENGKKCVLMDKIKYLPVDLEQVFYVRMIYLLKFQAKFFALYLGIQLLFAWIFTGRAGIENIVYTAISGYMIPVLLGMLYLWQGLRIREER
ncbi:MAG: hypothetical protein ACI4AD_08350 [Roseburia sp.]